MLSITACNITRVVPDGEKLLVQNKIVRGDSKGVDLSDEKDNLRQKPNRELLGFIKFHLWAYQYGTQGIGIRKKQTKIRKLAEKIGEAPVLIDSQIMSTSTQKLSDYYFSQGFFDNEVSYRVVPKKFYKKRAIVEYRATLGEYTTIKSLTYNATSVVINQELERSKKDARVKVNNRLSFDDIEDERSRITEHLRNTGFYYFNNSFIDFQIDTNQNTGQADVVVHVRNQKDFSPHYRQTLHEVVVIIGDKTNKDTIHFDRLKFLEGSFYIKPSALAKNIIFRPGNTYNASLVQKTYSNLLSMGLFKFVTIRFRASRQDSLSGLVAEIILQTAAKHDFTWEPQAIATTQANGIATDVNNTFGNETSVGMASVFSLQNRNVFGGAETFNVSSLTAVETQLKKDDQGPVNSFRQSVNTELVFPSLLYLERRKISKVLVKKSTKITATFLHDRNVNFTRNVLPINFTYSFTKDRFSFGVTPFRFSLNKASVDPKFWESLDNELRFYTSQLLTNNIIVGPTASFFWTNQNLNSKKYWKVRSNALELSGNLVDAYFRLFTDQSGINKEIFGVQYSQYARTDIDVVRNHIFDENKAIAARVNFGAGLPYGNTRFLPFERRFFIGGGSSLRAWRPRTIGPGSYSDSASDISIEKTGEILLQANAEYRFDIVDKLIDGAVFFDGGNIWNFRDNTSFDNADFKFNRFYKELALNTGLGLRFDLSYVIFRTDWGIALHDPSMADGSRWVIQNISQNKWLLENTAVNFAIGFPF